MKKTPFFGVYKKLSDLFPQIKDLYIKIFEFSYFNELNPHKMIETHETFTGRINCSNEFCKNGGLDIRHIIKDMYKKKETNRTDNEKCNGIIGKGINPPGCSHYFEFSIEIEYKVNGKNE